VINVGMVPKIRRMHFREGISLREVVRRTGLSRNRARSRLRAAYGDAPVRLRWRRSGLRPGERYRKTDLAIKAGVADYLALALRREDPDTLFFKRRLVMTGDTDLGLVVKNALDAIDWSRLPWPLRGF